MSELLGSQIVGNKAPHREEGEQKTNRISTRISSVAKEGLTEQANQLGISVAELLEQLGRGELLLATSELGEAQARV